MTRFLSNLFVSQPFGSRRQVVSAVGAVLLGAAAIAANTTIFAGVDRFPTDMHAAASLDLAVNRARCGKVGLISEVFVPSRYLREHPDAMRQPLSRTLDANENSPGGYCRSVVVPYTNNENGLMLLEAAMLAVRPTVSPSTLGLALAAARAMTTMVVVYVGLQVGLSLWLTAVVVAVLAAVEARLSIYQFTVYPLAVTNAVLLSALVTLAAGVLRGRSTVVNAIAGFVLGAIGGLAINVRTSHTIVYAALALELAAVLYALSARDHGGRAGWARPVSLLLAVIAGAAAFDLAFVRPIRVAAARASNNYVFHTVAHPLVMGLAAPPSDFSRREGLEWNDSIGLQVARRVDPNATFLGPTYERALLTYYFGLWRDHPSEMLAVYWRKLLTAGRGVFLQASELMPKAIRRVYLIFADRANGFELLVGSLGVALVAFWRSIRTGSPRAFGLAVVATVTFMMVAEAAIIFPTFFLAYHAWLLLAVAVAPPIALQLAIDAARRPRLVSPPS